jgi:hypothetical protein
LYLTACFRNKKNRNTTTIGSIFCVMLYHLPWLIKVVTSILMINVCWLISMIWCFSIVIFDLFDFSGVWFFHFGIFLKVFWGLTVKFFLMSMCLQLLNLWLHQLHLTAIFHIKKYRNMARIGYFISIILCYLACFIIVRPNLMIHLLINL